MARFLVGIGQTAVATHRDDVIEMVGLGSWVGIFIAAAGQIAVASHSLLVVPRNGEGTVEPGKYVETAVPFLLDTLEAAGVAGLRKQAWVVGGADMFHFDDRRDRSGLGERNTARAIGLLREHRIWPDTSYVGGTSARRVSLSLSSGELAVNCVPG